MNKDKMNNIKKSLKELVPYVILIMIVVLFRTFIATPVKVNGTSMINTLQDGDTMILNKIKVRTKGIKRFDIVVIKTNVHYLIKRVIGLPREKIKYKVDEDKKIGTLYINGKKIKENFITDETKSLTCNNESELCKEGVLIPNNYYFVMGDNRGNSIDSRLIGVINKKDITGTTKLTVFPITSFGIKK